jgi:hypothetical protein
MMEEEAVDVGSEDGLVRGASADAGADASAGSGPVIVLAGTADTASVIVLTRSVPLVLDEPPAGVEALVVPADKALYQSATLSPPSPSLFFPSSTVTCTPSSTLRPSSSYCVWEETNIGGRVTLSGP